MKFLSILTLAALTIVNGAAAPLGDPVPEPSSGIMLLLGGCAVGVGIAGRLRGRRPE